MELLRIALGEYGVSELSGGLHEKRILEYFKVAGHSWVKTDETAWCSAFINYCAIKAGLEATKKLNARSWLDVGKKVKKPTTGDIVVFWRESKKSWKGHVGIYINQQGDYINVLGGNQGNRVKISAYHKDRLLSYQRL